MRIKQQVPQSLTDSTASSTSSFNSNASTAPPNYSTGFCDFLNDSPTVFHAVAHYARRLERAGYVHLSERDAWQDVLKPNGKYYLTRNGSSLVAFALGGNFKPGNGIALIGSHIDALTLRVKPVSKKSSLGYLQLGVSPYAGGGNMTWWDRDLGLAGRVLVTDPKTGAITQQLVRLPHPVAKIPTLAPHFGAPSNPPFNPETQMTPIIGFDKQSEAAAASLEAQFNALSTQPPINEPTQNHAPRVLAAVARQLGIQVQQIADLELELFDHQPAQPFGLDGDLLSVPRCDDKLCSYAAMEALLNATGDAAFLSTSNCIHMVYLADDEEIGSGLRQGAAGNTIPITIERIVGVLNKSKQSAGDLLAMTFARSFFISADVKHALNPNVIHAVNPNFAGAYELNMAPRLNVGPVISCDPNGHMTTDAPSKAIAQQIAKKTGVPLQLFQIRNDSRSGGTIGPMLSKATGMRAIDIGIPQLAMHSIRATTGREDPGLGVRFFEGFFRHFEAVDHVTVD